MFWALAVEESMRELMPRSQFQEFELSWSVRADTTNVIIVRSMAGFCGHKKAQKAQKEPGKSFVLFVPLSKTLVHRQEVATSQAGYTRPGNENENAYMTMIIAGFIVLFAQQSGAQSPLRVLCSNGMKAVLEDLRGRAEREIGRPLGNIRIQHVCGNTTEDSIRRAV
jgi:hypothetical protein